MTNNDIALQNCNGSPNIGAESQDGRCGICDLTNST